MINRLVLFLILACVGCSSEISSVDTLGQNNDFSDVEIGQDFMDPMEETPGETVVPETPNEQTVEIVSFKNTFFLEDRTFSLAHGSANRWDGCEDGFASEGGYNSNSRCGRAFLHHKFSTQLNEYFFRCISDAAKEAGYPQPQRIFINHLGSYNDRPVRNGSRLSNHAYARALDIATFNLYDSSNKLFRVSTLLREYKGSQAKFYDEFRQCWSESLPSNCRPGQSEYIGSIGHNSSKLGGNTLHNDHIHLSLPLCAG